LFFTNINIVSQLCVLLVIYFSRISIQICVMQHRGEIVKKAIYQSGMSITLIAKKIGKSRRWMYQMFENNNVSLDLVLEIGQIIHYDFTDEIREINYTKVNLQDNQPTYVKLGSEEVEFWKNKYLLLLEEYNELLKKTDI